MAWEGHMLAFPCIRWRQHVIVRGLDEPNISRSSYLLYNDYPYTQCSGTVCPLDPVIPFKFSTRRFPIKTVLAMTTNKAKRQRLNCVGIYQWQRNGKLPLRTCPERSVPEPYRSPDWALVPAKTGPKAEY
jgi:hypothetical protein